MRRLIIRGRRVGSRLIHSTVEGGAGWGGKRSLRREEEIADRVEFEELVHIFLYPFCIVFFLFHSYHFSLSPASRLFFLFCASFFLSVIFWLLSTIPPPHHLSWIFFLAFLTFLGLISYYRIVTGIVSSLSK